ncbi:hypothetical protein ATANTOWER_008373 [Ataeniobius toweri]|uniref:Uncharacterized protein n=1 Tax=Ataeniobius toweri TaxID=208326 RepID=A0ABU7BC70_9TELE|nr:hypothetical protein [Ataeniobius toweri]
MAGVSVRWCTCGSRYTGLGALVCASSLPVAACQGLGPWALSGLCLGSDVSQGLRSLGPWLDLLWHRLLPAGPVGLSLQLPGASALRLLGGSLGILPCSSLGELQQSWLWFSWGSCALGGPLDVWGSVLLRICPGSRGAGLWLLTLAIAFFYGETLYTQALRPTNV